MTLRGAWVGVVATGFGLALVALVLVHGGGAAEVIPRLAIAVPLAVVGVVTAFVAGRFGRTSDNVMLWLGVIVVVGAVANLLPSFVLPGEGGWPEILPLIHPAGVDFRDGLYDPAAAFSSAHSAWPPLTLVLGRPFTLVSATSGYLIQVAMLVVLAVAVTFLSAKLAMKAVARPALAGQEQSTTATRVFVVMGLWLVTSYGFLFEFERGNLDLYALFFSLMSVWLLLRPPKSVWLPAVFLALAINLKLYPAVLLVLLFWRYRWRAVLPVVAANLVLLLVAGPSNAWHFLVNVSSMQGHPSYWIGNHSAASYAYALRGIYGWLPSWLGYALLLIPLALWAFTIVVLIKRGWSDRGAVLAAAACVPVMCYVPSVSHDYKLVLLVFPLAVLAVVVATMKRDSRTLWSVLFWLLGVEMVFLARSTLLMTPFSSLRNKYPLLLLVQMLLLAVALMSGGGNAKEADPPAALRRPVLLQAHGARVRRCGVDDE